MIDIIQKHSAGGILLDEEKVLTIKWTTKDAVEFPKGTLEPGESSEQAAVREVFEETGYRTEILRSLGTSTYEYDLENGKRYRKTVDFFVLGRIDEAEPTPHRQAGEHFENNWLDVQEAFEQLTHDDSKELLRKALA